MGYQPIENYGVIGDMHTVALVGMNGSIDWFCCPAFDSPSIFAAILDDEKGGHFKISPAAEEATHKQLYWPETNVLITRFMSEKGVCQITDFMPVNDRGKSDKFVSQLIRIVKVVKGTMRLRMECFPAFNYARDKHETRIDEYGALFVAGEARMRLSTTIDLEEDIRGAVAEFKLDRGQTVTFCVSTGEDQTDVRLRFSKEASERLFEETVAFWQTWLSQCTYRGRWREMVERSALVLKLLTYEPTGAIIAAPTCSLPEIIGGGRNWDYRYAWIRDAAFTIYSLLKIGFTEEAKKFMGWIEERADELETGSPLQIMYGIDGRQKLTEETLDHLEGYRGSNPVRVGNGAYDQLQLDIYGELIDSVYLFNKDASPISFDFWTHITSLTDWVADNWQKEDEGIWEVRGPQQQFVYSKLMCWVALDRAIKIADYRSFPADRNRWQTARDAIYQDIMDKGWSPSRQAFVQSYGSETLDASNLMMPMVYFMSPTDPKMIGTLDATRKDPRDGEHGGLVSDSLVYRYDVNKTCDGLSGKEGTFNICTFWLVDAMTRAARAGSADSTMLNQARLTFEQMLGYANHLGLYAEETGPRGEALGNFPQAFSHLALISAATILDETLGDQN